MKSKLVILLTVLLIVSLVISGCATKTTPAEKPAEKPASTKVITLIAASHVPKSYHDISPQEWAFVNDVNKEGAGRVQIKFYDSGTLLKANELVPGLKNGTADIIFQTSSHTTGSWPVMGIVSLPFLYKNAYDLRERFKIGSPLFELVNKTLEEKNGVEMLAFGALPLEYLWTNKPIKDLTNLKGLTIRVGGADEANAIKSLGGSPVTMSSGELYEALQRGTIDGVVCYPGTIAGRSLQEVVKYCYKLPISAYGRCIFVEKSKWDSLPEDVRTLLSNEAIKYDYNYLENAEKVHNNESWPKFKKAGMKIIEPSEEVVEKVREKCKPTWNEWSKEIGTDLGDQLIKLATSKMEF
jgi:TRAP-type C4-dicarboxylate transport system substrate-binding protein